MIAGFLFVIENRRFAELFHCPGLAADDQQPGGQIGENLRGKSRGNQFRGSLAIQPDLIRAEQFFKNVRGIVDDAPPGPASADPAPGESLVLPASLSGDNQCQPFPANNRAIQAANQFHAAARAPA